MRSARSFMPGLGDNAVTYVLVKVKAGESVEAVKQRINALPHLAAYTTREMSTRTFGAI